MPKVKLPTQLREAAGGESAVSVEGATVGAVLEALYERHSELRDRDQYVTWPVSSVRSSASRFIQACIST